jgi:hypothetical protein
MRWIMTIIMLLHGVPAFAGKVVDQAAAPISLAELAANADLVVLAQTRDTDYFTRRDIPVSGSAYLKVLIPYKMPRQMKHPADLIEVYENGLHDHECYFLNPSVFEEGRRYLLFLKKDAEDEERYRGLPQGCALDVLVDSENRYAVRYPVTGIDLSDPIGELASGMKFSDGYAIVDDDELLPAQRDAMLSASQITPYQGPGRQWVYTSGISLTAIRELMELDPLSHQAITGFVGFTAGQLHAVVGDKGGQDLVQ